MMNLASEFVSRGWSRDLVQRARVTPIDEHGAARPLSAAELRRFDVGAYLFSEWVRDSSVAKDERAAVAEVMRRSAFAVDGALLPFSLLSQRDFNVNTPSQAGNLAGDAPRLFDLGGDALRAAPILDALGVPTVGGFSGSPVIPSFATGTAGAAATEVGAVSPGATTTRGQTLAPNRISTVLHVSNQFQIQSPGGVSLLLRSIRAGLGAEVERQFFSGTGSGGELLGLRNLPGVGSVVAGPNGASLTFAHLCDLENAANSGVAESAPGFAVNGATRRYLRTLPRGAGLAFVWEGGPTPLLGHRAAVSSNLPSNIAKGTGSNLSALAFSRDWSQSALCLFGEGLGLVFDRVTRADRAETRIVASIYCDIAWIQPGAFSVMSDAATV